MQNQVTLCCAFAGPIIATFLALAVGLGALISTSLAVMSFVWVIPAAAVLLSLGGLFVFPAFLTLVSHLCPICTRCPACKLTCWQMDYSHFETTCLVVESSTASPVGTSSMYYTVRCANTSLSCCRG